MADIVRIFNDAFELEVADRLAQDAALDAVEIQRVKDEMAKRLAAELAADAEQDAAVLKAKDEQIGVLTGTVAARDDIIAGQNGKLTTLRASIAELEASVSALTLQIGSKDAEIVARDGVIAALRKRIAELEPVQQPPAPPSPPSPPPAPGKPDATNTGVRPGVTLIVVNGGYTTKAKGELIKGKHFKGPVLILHDDCFMEDCEVETADYYAVRFETAKNFTLRYCEINGKNAGHVGAHGTGTIQRNNIYGFGDAINIAGRVSPTLIEDNYLHGMGGSSATHFDTIQCDGDVANIIIRWNTIINEKGQTSALMIDNFWGPIDNVLVEENWMEGGGFTVYVGQWANGPAGGWPVTNVRVINNRLKKGAYDYVDFGPLNKPGAVMWSGNVDDVTGAEV